MAELPDARLTETLFFLSQRSVSDGHALKSAKYPLDTTRKLPSNSGSAMRRNK